MKTEVKDINKQGGITTNDSLAIPAKKIRETL